MHTNKANELTNSVKEKEKEKCKPCCACPETKLARDEW